MTSALVSGYPGSYCVGFQKLNDAISFMEDRQCPSYKLFCDSAEGERAPGKGERVYYAVRTLNTLEYMNATSKLLLLSSASLGIFDSVIEGGAEGEITGYSHSYYKVFRSWRRKTSLRNTGLEIYFGMEIRLR